MEMKLKHVVAVIYNDHTKGVLMFPNQVPEKNDDRKGHLFDSFIWRIKDAFIL